MHENRLVSDEATSAEADARAQERRADSAVEADPLGNRDHVSPRRLADVRDLVDEGDPRYERGIRGQLDHLRRGDVTADDGRLDSAVQLLDDVSVGWVERTHDDPVGPQEVPDGCSLGGELRVRDVADVLEPPRVEPVA